MEKVTDLTLSHRFLAQLLFSLLVSKWFCAQWSYFVCLLIRSNKVQSKIWAITWPKAHFTASVVVSAPLNLRSLSGGYQTGSVLEVRPAAAWGPPPAGGSSTAAGSWRQCGSSDASPGGDPGARALGLPAGRRERLRATSRYFTGMLGFRFSASTCRIY